MLANFFYILLNILTIINFLFAVFVVFFERKNPGTIWAWLFVFALVPYAGFIIYLFFGFDGRKDKFFREKLIYDEKLLKDYLELNPYVIENQLDLTEKQEIIRGHHTEYLNDFVFLSIFASQSPYTSNNRIKTYHKGTPKFKDLIRDIKKAEKFIHLEYYIFNNDNMGKTVLSLLCEKAKNGVEVRLMIDGVGNLYDKKKMIKPFIENGGKFSVFLSPKFFRINNRNHRKLAVIDGKIGYIGGLNIGDEYCGKSKKYGFWRDSHIRIKGDAVHLLELRFMSDWNFCSKDSRLYVEEFYFPHIQRLDKSEEKIPVQIISSGADSRFNSIQQSYFKMITEANKSIYIETPYFVPDDSILEALKIAALSGHDVKIIIPYKPDHILVQPAAFSYIGELLEAGVKCYLYKGGFIHSKVMTMDSMITSVGTANMDIRSFRLNFEINAFIYDDKVTKDFNEAFKRDLQQCEELTLCKYNKRGRIQRIKEAMCRLISPML